MPELRCSIILLYGILGHLVGTPKQGRTLSAPACFDPVCGQVRLWIDLHAPLVAPRAPRAPVVVCFFLGSSGFCGPNQRPVWCISYESVGLATYSTLHSNCISFISFGEVTPSLHFTLQILHFMLLTLLLYCKGLHNTHHALFSVVDLPYIVL